MLTTIYIYIQLPQTNVILESTKLRERRKRKLRLTDPFKLAATLIVLVYSFLFTTKYSDISYSIVSIILSCFKQNNPPSKQFVVSFQRRASFDSIELKNCLWDTFQLNRLKIPDICQVDRQVRMKKTITTRSRNQPCASKRLCRSSRSHNRPIFRSFSYWPST